jgi:hypothetical protein
MKHILLLCSILSQWSVIAIEIPQKLKLCINCKYYTKNFFSSSEYGQCRMFIRVNDNDSFLVNGINNKKIENYYCSTARNSEKMCGQDGKFYERK